MRALQISAYGDPLSVLELVDIPEPVVPGMGEVLIDVELAPLNLHDLLFMRGFFGGPPAPTVVGNEGFGRVAAVGPGVTNVKVGDHVRPQSRSSLGACRRSTGKRLPTFLSHLSRLDDGAFFGAMDHRLHGDSREIAKNDGRACRRLNPQTGMAPAKYHGPV